jgi:hypothetical protein
MFMFLNMNSRFEIWAIARFSRPYLKLLAMIVDSGFAFIKIIGIINLFDYCQKTSKNDIFLNFS